MYSTPVSLPPQIAVKSDLRKAALALREALPAAGRAKAAEAVAAWTFPVPVASGTSVSGFSPLKSEISPLPLMRKLADRGAQLAVPVGVGRVHNLHMRALAFGEPLAQGAWSV